MSNVKFFLPTSAELISNSEIFLRWEKIWDFWSFQEILKTIASGQSVLVCAKKDETITAMAFWAYSKDESELLYVYVPEELRGQNLGRQLLETSFQYLRERGVRIGFLEVRPSNLNALFLYQRLGFLEISRRKSYYANGEDCIVMRKEFV